MPESNPGQPISHSASHPTCAVGLAGLTQFYLPARYRELNRLEAEHTALAPSDYHLQHAVSQMLSTLGGTSLGSGAVFDRTDERGQWPVVSGQ